MRKGSSLRTPPIIPVSMPKSMPPKQAWDGGVRRWVFGGERDGDGAYACAEDKDSPVVDFLRVIFHGFVAAG